MRFYLARHGETQWNLEGKLQGQLDSPLTERGIEQANELGIRLQCEGIEFIYASSLSRAKNTADICQQHLRCEVSYSDDIVERHFGDWQGKSLDELYALTQTKNVYEAIKHIQPKGAETEKSSADRFAVFLQQIGGSQTKSLIVSHGDIIRNFLKYYFDISALEGKAELSNGTWLVMDYDYALNQFSLVST